MCNEPHKSILKEKIIDLSQFITPLQAQKIIYLFNNFRNDSTKLGFHFLFLYFIWKPNEMIIPKKTPLRFVEIVHGRVSSHDNSTRALKNEHASNALKQIKHDENEEIQTAATNGFTLWINKFNIMNKKFNEVVSNYGKLPDQVSHFSAVMLHEFGHILRKRANKTTVVKIRRYNKKIQDHFDLFYKNQEHELKKTKGKKQNKKKARCFEEWFADAFAVSFILHAFDKKQLN